MRTTHTLAILLLIFTHQFCGCKPKSKPRTGPHRVIVLEVDTFGNYRHPGQFTPSKIHTLTHSISAVIRKRLIKAGVSIDSIEVSDTNTHVTVKLWHLEEQGASIERVRKLIQEDGKLGFWETFDAKDAYAELFPGENAIESDTLNFFHRELIRYLNLDSARLFHIPYGIGPLIGYAEPKDTMNADIILSKLHLPKNMHFLWSFKRMRQNNNLVALYAIKGIEPAMTGEVVAAAKAAKGGMGSPVISITMNDAGAEKWRVLTKDNIKKEIAITFDDRVCTSPRVMSEISAGKCDISGDFTMDEAKDLAALLTAGDMPAQVRIVAENIEN